MDPGQRAAVFVWVFFVFLWLIQNCILAWNVTDWDVFRYRLLPNVFISPTSVVVNRASKPKFKRRNRFWTVDVIYRCSAFLHLPGLNVFKLPSRCTCFILSSWTSPNKAWHDGAWLGTCLKSQYSRLVVCWVVFEMDACIVFILMQKYFVLSDGGFFCFVFFCFVLFFFSAAIPEFPPFKRSLSCEQRRSSFACTAALWLRKHLYLYFMLCFCFV